MRRPPGLALFFFFNDTATTEIYTLSLHDALPISPLWRRSRGELIRSGERGIDGIDQDARPQDQGQGPDRKSTRLNSSHGYISYAVFCLKKKTTTRSITTNYIPAMP